ncbi:3-oxo-5-alpha-steroid 4-dehydrogenase-domain-containing protein [Mycotypha africana]|uniref:3-oxo-5-alpha-steroid 4-dehydrogenase-domain-containing protein n=1 Tax=Mycotypha africana TaxID=64632 RepID=UPI0022FFDA6D|nr:3-oxo-5-alpha-steroid 4-dehydrogenase-domain-containing protein [Mycotypha africana]KAI8975069.1 3-oxo-5-alpha-steroid 4-dehydrogenase-domain-containing protein [Mycotypha africana]
MYFDWSISNILIAIASLTGSGLLIIREYTPATRLQYSKFASSNLMKDNIKSNEITISSFHGMLVIYVPSLILTTLLLFKTDNGSRMSLITALNVLHYLKRVTEVIFVHRYSGQSKLIDNILISISYMVFAFFLSFFSAQVPHPNAFLTVVGVALFFIGEGTNCYHHLILSNLRKDGSKEYKIPQEGLFKYIWCPHYTGEIVAFIAMAFLSQHFLVLILQICSAGYLAIRAYNTRSWYKSKFTDIPHRACLIPFIF